MKKLDRFVIVCSGLLVENGRVLMVQETKKSAAGQYFFPGGTLEPNESIHQALVREVREETGLQIKPGRLLGIYERVTANLGNHVIVLVFRVIKTGGRLRNSKEHSEVRFVTVSEIEKFTRSGKLRFRAVTLALAELKKKPASVIPVIPI